MIPSVPKPKLPRWTAPAWPVLCLARFWAGFWLSVLDYLTPEDCWAELFPEVTDEEEHGTIEGV